MLEKGDILMDHMSIKDAAKNLNVESHVLRYWEEELGLEIKRNSLGHRYYNEKDIKMFKQIQELKDKGFALKDIREGIEKRKITKENVQGKESDTVTATLENQSPCKQEHNNSNENHPSVSSTADINVIDFKTAQLQAIMNKIVANALKENKDIITSSIKEEITTDVMKQFDTVMREKEEKEEARFRKLDETLRRLQQANEEVAATKTKKRFFRNH